MGTDGKDWKFHKMTSQGFYKLEVPPKLNMARLIVDYWAEHGRGDDVAIYHKDEKITYRQLQDLTDRFANAVHKLGLNKGDRYVIRTPNCPEFMISFLGGQKIGAVPIPTNPMLREYELTHIINNSETVALVTTSALVQTIENIRPQCPTLKHIICLDGAHQDYLSFHEILAQGTGALPVVETHKDDRAYFLYTSGTTGPPKGVVHGHRFIVGAGDPIGKFTMGLERGDICGGPTALTWMYALGHNFLFAFRWGVSTAIYSDERFDPGRAFEFIQQYKITVFAGTPTIYRMMLTVKDAEKRYDVSSLKYCLSSGEPLLVETCREWERRFGVRTVDSMGQTEAHEFCTTQTDLQVRLGSMGKPLPGIEVAVVDSEGKRLPPGEMGHLAIRRDHPGLFLEYFRMLDKMEEVSLPDNWYDTKDLAVMDEDGYFWYSSRSDDIMTCRGYRISPAEVETALQEHVAVLESGVAGAPDAEMGDKVKAWVVLHKGYVGTPELAKELQQHVKNLIAPYKYPREIEFIDSLPKTSSGKILRRELRRLEKEKLAGKTTAENDSGGWKWDGAMNVEFTIEEKTRKRNFRCAIKGAVICGYTGREQAAIRKHIEELEKQDIKPPPSVPMFYPKPSAGLCLDDDIHVKGAKTTGELEFVLLADKNKLYVGAGSDHTDRELEKQDILKSKQVCPSVVSKTLWDYEEIKDHWDRIELRSWAISGEEKVLYQESTMASILTPDDLIAKVRERVLGDIDGIAIYSGTPALLTDGFVFGHRFEGELSDPVLGRKICFGYNIHSEE